MITFWETYLEIDKMAWLRLNNRNWDMPILVKPWDCKDDIHVFWSIMIHDDTVWEWVIYTKDEINRIFTPFLSWWEVRPYSRRQWELWRPKTVWIIRLQSEDWSIFALNSCNWWWELQRSITNIEEWKIALITLSSQYNKKLTTVLLDTEWKHKKRISRLTC